MLCCSLLYKNTVLGSNLHLQNLMLSFLSQEHLLLLFCFEEGFVVLSFSVWMEQHGSCPLIVLREIFFQKPVWVFCLKRTHFSILRSSVFMHLVKQIILINIKGDVEWKCAAVAKNLNQA